MTFQLNFKRWHKKQASNTNIHKQILFAVFIKYRKIVQYTHTHTQTQAHGNMNPYFLEIHEFRYYRNIFQPLFWKKKTSNHSQLSSIRYDYSTSKSIYINAVNWVKINYSLHVKSFYFYNTFLTTSTRNGPSKQDFDYKTIIFSL